MRFPTRTALVLMLTLVAMTVAAQDAATQSPTTTAAATSTAATDPAGETATTDTAATGTAGEESAAPERRSSYEVRAMFSNVLRENPPDLTRVLQLDPTLLSNAQYMSGYPAIASFVERYPEVRQNPRFYLGEFAMPEHREPVLEQIMETLVISGTMIFIALALAWLVRTIIEQKRWSRLSRTQTEVHNKILDRFATSDELLAYVKTPAGTKFLESAPIAVGTEPVAQPQNAPMQRIIWSVQIGVVVALGALGMFLVSFRFEKEAAADLFALGVIAFCVGVGFILSAAISLMLSNRLGLWRSDDPSRPIGDSGLVR